MLDPAVGCFGAPHRVARWVGGLLCWHVCLRVGASVLHPRGAFVRAIKWVPALLLLLSFARCLGGAGGGEGDVVSKA